MYRYQVGQPYNPNRRQWPEGMTYQWRSGGHELLIFQSRLTTSDQVAARSGPLDLALVVDQPAILLCVRMPGFLDWSEAIYSYHLVPSDEQQLPPELAPGQGVLLPILLAGADDGILRAIRVVTLPHAVAAPLHAAIRAQAASPFDAAAYHRHVDSLLADPSAVIQRRAVARVSFRRDEGRTPSSLN